MTIQSNTARRFAMCVGAVAWFGILLQLVLSLSLAAANGRSLVWGLVIYLGFFTVLTNILVGLVVVVPLVAPGSAAGRFFATPGATLTAAATIAMVGLAYHMLLRQVWNPQGWQLVADVVLHYVTPVLFLLYWWTIVPNGRLRGRHVVATVAYPAGYLAYMLIRGELMGVYPYHFADVHALGYAHVLWNALGLLSGIVILAAVLFALARVKQVMVSSRHRRNIRSEVVS